ncbi:SLC13/DASS family transporter [Pacificimonas sp. WHA3]|uniref:SLC13/DASS family transporter n=1 Tax=Pacificimonas pallii TaxID=2827236 RepID=A0ABS6SIU2_9SPHN|nr:DASS family sodium-coupled anion symporter [Pacificimonas pallii]MBV7257851.1 SLC13/DASS family transporter [Pacificimonas pallii]
MSFKPVWIAIGLTLFALLKIIPAPDGMSPEAWTVAALGLLMLSWWVSEAVPIPVTSLLPLVILPLFDVLSFKEAAPPYASPIVLLLMGGFIIAKSVETWGLHTRFALGIVARSGASPAAMVGGFMAASALLSMWISNTATAIMLTPIALSVAQRLRGDGWQGAPVTIALLLGVAYGCSIGGIGTPIGTPTNLIVLGYLENEFGRSIGFADWMAYGIPMVLVLLPLAWLALTKLSLRVADDANSPAQDVIADERAKLGRMTTPERRVATAFAAIALAWMFRRPLTEMTIGGAQPFAGVTDHWIAIAGAILFFLVPAGGGERRALLSWPEAERIPWGVLLLFGGGLSLAAAITATGLGEWMGARLTILNMLPLILLIAALTTFVIFWTEITSNVATASALMPVIGAVAAAGGGDPLYLAMPVAVAASCAFMLPMATGPNAIAYASGAISMPQMARAGLILNLLAIAAISCGSALLLPILLG